MKKIILLTGFLFLVLGTVVADSFKVGELFYEIIDPKGKTVRVVFHHTRPYDNLTKVEIPSQIKYDGKKYTVIEIGDRAFSLCDMLQELTLPPTLQKIGFKSFSKCASLPMVILPASLEEIGELAFEKCISLQSIDIPQKVTKIRPFTFSFCAELATIILPAACVELEDGAFWECRSLTKITSFAVEPPAMALPSKQNNGSFFKQTATQCTVFVPKNSKTKYAESDWGKMFDVEKIVESN